jgi:hypothetical protein
MFVIPMRVKFFIFFNFFLYHTCHAVNFFQHPVLLVFNNTDVWHCVCVVDPVLQQGYTSLALLTQSSIFIMSCIKCHHENGILCQQYRNHVQGVFQDNFLWKLGNWTIHGKKYDSFWKDTKTGNLCK